MITNRAYCCILLISLIAIDHILCDPQSEQVVDLTSPAFDTTCLRSHNELRKHHCVLPLRLDDNAQRAAKSYAKYLAENDGNIPTTGRHVDANQLYYSISVEWVKGFSAPDCSQVIERWYSEISKYQWNEPDDEAKEMVKRFGQIVWRTVTDLGCAIFRGGGDERGFAVVCYYYPKIDQTDKWEFNVLNPTGCIGSIKENQNGNIFEESLENKTLIRSEDDVSLQAVSLTDGFSRWGPDDCNDREFICRVTQPLDDFERECLRVHNELRRSHRVPSLRTSRKLVEVAMRRAITMAGRNLNIAHLPNMPFGENLHQIAASPHAIKVNCTAAVKSFYREIANYDYRSGRSVNKKPVGHFTQLIWKSSREVGCAQATYTGRDKMKRTITVCEYEPYGNIRGLYDTMVLPPR